MTFSDLEVAVSQASRVHGHVRDSVLATWTPGAGDVQQVYSRELAGSMLRECDEFFDRALALYLLRTHLRGLQASTWAGVAVYYSNYFSVVSFIRLHMRSVTHLQTGPSFEVSRADNATPLFRIRRRGDRLGHSELWRAYYDLINEMGWPDAATAAVLAPNVGSLRFREQVYRERINYRPGEGFEEIYQSRTRYQSSLRTALRDEGLQPLAISDSAYTDRMAAERLKHLAMLLRRLGTARPDPAVEAACWNRRSAIAEKYAMDRADKRFAKTLLAVQV